MLKKGIGSRSRARRQESVLPIDPGRHLVLRSGFIAAGGRCFVARGPTSE